ncbi:MAG: phosphate ABC transporter substrate-binding protein PstS [Actinobacteria bacterium]|nr:phosphate ABC transporter substrate-binding protein PstS [Actinomycetota bacterium]OJU82866.1 MAG: phosphate ABC transporter substrate-binding protein PstS [Solirubrobacterales bacterium 70-9]
MSSSRWLAVFAAALVLVLGLAACGGSDSSSSGSSSESENESGGGAPSAEVSGEIAGAGSTAQEASQKAWIAEFENANGGATVSYDGVGSGGGREKFISNAVAFAGSDTPLSEAEGELGKAIKRCGPGELVEVPDYISPIAIVYNLPGVEELKLEPETLAKIFNQEIENWNDPEIEKENPGVELPETRIVPVNRSDESGTTENFTDYLSKVAPSVWTHEVSGEWPVKGGEAASGTSGVIEAVSAGEGAIGYADASQAGELGKALIKVGSTWAEPSPEAAAKILDLSKEDPELEKGQKNVIAFEIDRKTEASGVYPIILVSSLIGCTKYKSADEAALVKAYFEYAISPEGQALSAEASGAAPLSAELTKKVEAAVGAIE